MRSVQVQMDEFKKSEERLLNENQQLKIAMSRLDGAHKELTLSQTKTQDENYRLKVLHPLLLANVCAVCVTDAGNGQLVPWLHVVEPRLLTAVVLPAGRPHCFAGCSSCGLGR